MNVHSHPAAPRVSRLAGCLAIALGVGAASAASPIPGHATSNPRGPVTRQVFSCDDASLRQAITSAMDGDTVAMPAGCSLITLDSGEIPILVDKLQLVGPGAQDVVRHRTGIERIEEGGQAIIGRQQAARLGQFVACTLGRFAFSRADGGHHGHGWPLWKEGALSKHATITIRWQIGRRPPIRLRAGAATAAASALCARQIPSSRRRATP